MLRLVELSGKEENHATNKDDTLFENFSIKQMIRRSFSRVCNINKKYKRSSLA